MILGSRREVQRVNFISSGTAPSDRRARARGLQMSPVALVGRVPSRGSLTSVGRAPFWMRLSYFATGGCPLDFNHVQESSGQYRSITGPGVSIRARDWSVVSSFVRDSLSCQNLQHLNC